MQADLRVEQYQQNEIILQRNYDKKAKQLQEMEQEITKEMRWTAAFSAKIKTKRKALNKAKKRFLKLCKKHNFKPEQADTIKIPGDVSESEINVDDFNNIEVKQEIEEEAKQRKIREEEFLKQIKAQQKEFIPGYKEDSLLPEPQKSKAKSKLPPATKAMQEVKRVEEKKEKKKQQDSEEEIDPDQIMENYLKKKGKREEKEVKMEIQGKQEKIEKEEEPIRGNVVKTVTIKTVKLKAAQPHRQVAPPL